MLHERLLPSSGHPGATLPDATGAKRSLEDQLILGALQGLSLRVSVASLWLFSLAVMWPHLPPWSTAGAPITVSVWRATPWLLPLLLLYFIATILVASDHPRRLLGTPPSGRALISWLRRPDARTSFWCMVFALVAVLVACVYLVLLNALSPTAAVWPGMNPSSRSSARSLRSAHSLPDTLAPYPYP